MDRGLTAILGLAGAASPRGPAAIAGIEQEYAVWDRDRQVDFRALLPHVLPDGSLRRFAFDAQAGFVRSGAIWTADPPHAEIATAPRPLRRGIASGLARDALAERSALLVRLRAGTGAPVLLPQLRGYSTHLNAFAGGVDGWRVTRHFLGHYAPAVLLLAERAGSPGLLVRPRPRRLEIGTEYLETFADLVSATVVVLAGTIASWRGVGGDENSHVPQPALEPLEVTGVQSTWQRPGLFVPHDAFGESVDGRGRAAIWRLGGGRSQAAGDRLKATWEHLRGIAETFCFPDELAIVDARVAGDDPLPLERNEPIEPTVDLPPIERARGRRAPFTSLLRPHQRGPVRLLPELLTWDLAVLKVEHPTRDFFLRLPTESTRRFEASWSSGRLDGPLATFAASPPADRVARLDEPAAGLFDDVESPSAAVARMGGPKAGVPADGKKRRPLMPLPVRPPVAGGGRRPWPLLVLVGLVLTTVVLLGNLPGRPGGGPTPSPTIGCLPDMPCPTRSLTFASASACPVGFVCGSPAPTPSEPASSIGPTPCPAGAVCGTPAPSPSPSPGPTPLPRPTPRPSPTPDTTPPTIGRLAWTPGTIYEVPPVGVAPCIPESVTITVVVSDPSGVQSVRLRYQRAGDPSPVSVAMTLSAGRYRTTLSTMTNPAAWLPSPGDTSYVVRMSVRAVDTQGNARTTPTINGFTVHTCP